MRAVGWEVVSGRRCHAVLRKIRRVCQVYRGVWDHSRRCFNHRSLSCIDWKMLFLQAMRVTVITPF